MRKAIWVMMAAAGVAAGVMVWGENPKAETSDLKLQTGAETQNTNHETPNTKQETGEHGRDARATQEGAGRYMFEEEIRPGMKGYGLTVMTGGKIEKFEVEIIDVVKNFSPGNNAILVRCSGLGLEHSGIIAGMSGSPVYIDGKMIGAVAFGWGMAKDPIAGVQPIRQMLAIETENIQQKTENGKGVRDQGTGDRGVEAGGRAGPGKV